MALRREDRQSPRIEVHIEELVLHGFAAGDRFAIGDAVERELGRLFADGGLDGLAGTQRRPVRMPQDDGGVFHIEPGAKPQSIGSGVAQAVHRKLSQPKGGKSR
jgi:hypothetical protein